ncbi:MAG: hypothetical protein IKW13_05955, partial [Thermoguttaceae bacterium]|nr:hypothetical protein [Thermoguttaceae bacterium]
RKLRLPSSLSLTTLLLTLIRFLLTKRLTRTAMLRSTLKRSNRLRKLRLPSSRSRRPPLLTLTRFLLTKRLTRTPVLRPRWKRSSR